MALFLATYINKVDRKGRVSVPASFRTALADQSFGGIVTFRSYKYPALDAFGADRMERLSASIDDLALFSEQQDDLAATIFADAQQLPFDSDGRIVLPESLAAHAGIRDRAAFVGRGPSFQIWEPEAFQRFQAEARDRVRRAGVTLKLRPTAGGDSGPTQGDEP
jgi:MraZ protein